MTEKNSNERKKLSLSLGGKLSLKNTVTPKLAGSVTTGARGNRNTVQVEVKRVKRNNARNEQLFNKKSETVGSLSPEQISSRSKELKEGLARTAAEAEKQAIVKNENLQNNNLNETQQNEFVRRIYHNIHRL